MIWRNKIETVVVLVWQNLFILLTLTFLDTLETEIMASSSNSFSGEEIKEISEIQAFIASENFDIDDSDYGETLKEEIGE